MATLTLKVEEQALTQVPCWESHKRGKNWCAEISKDPAAPGGLARSFWGRARGDYYYHLPADLTPGVPLEFGADYYSAGGRPSRERVYAVVTAASPDLLTLETYDTATQAIKAAEEFTAGVIIAATQDSDALHAAKMAANELEAADLRALVEHMQTLLAARSPAYVG